MRHLFPVLWLVIVSAAGKGLDAQSVPSTEQQTTTVASRETPATEAPCPQPSNAIPKERIGDILMARKEYRDAIEVYREVYLECWNKLPILYNKIGIAYHQMGQLDLALMSYENATRLNPNYAEAMNNIGTVYYSKKDYKKAEEYFRKALELNPNSASIYSNLGTALFARKRYEEAIKAYQKALELDPEVFKRRGTVGSLLQQRSVEERALFHYYLAKLYAQMGLIEEALLEMRKAIEEGFREKQKFLEDPAFASLYNHPEFQRLLKYEPGYLEN